MLVLYYAEIIMTFFFSSRSDEYSWKRSRELLLEVARKGEETGYGVPCLLIAAKEDRDRYPMAAQDSMRVYNFSCYLVSPPYMNIFLIK